MKRTRLNSTKFFGALLFLYFLIGFSLLSRLSLWLDEVIDLRQIRDLGWRQLLAAVPVNAGGVPLSYLIRKATIELLGYSTLTARLPSLLFSVAAAAGVFAIGRQTKLKSPTLAAILFCLVPLQFRYALESRPYSQALAIGSWATWVFLVQLDRRGRSLATLYGVLAVAALYTQPFTIFVFVAHLFYLLSEPTLTERRRLVWLTFIPIALAVLTFLPWQLTILRLWNRASAPHEAHGLGWRTAPMILRELTGAGYAGTAAMATLVAWGLVAITRRRLWIALILLPILLALAADWYFSYFFAIRQVITVLPALCVLVAAGIEDRAAMNRSTAGTSACATVTVVLVVIFFIGNFSYFHKRREDWRSAARILSGIPARGSCILFLPADSVSLYAFFEPGLAQRECPASLGSFALVAVARSPYGHVDPKLQSRGFRRVLQLNSQGPMVELYVTRR